MQIKVADPTLVLAILLAAFAAAFVSPPAEAQYLQQLPNQPAPQVHPVVPGGASQSGTTGIDDDPMAHHMATQLAKSRNAQRQQQLVSDTAKLLELANELKTEVDKSGKDTLSLAVVKKAEEIEKLAKSVRDKMRDAQ
ncbi:hypothetical protein HNQ77_001338 [Silvibacterium bohemicum]|uniref:Uncharacterized protein n=1 Tax=Silvibacterium bohemicum TaxID=1577686 RepID=A0A841JZH4_9BACT|nr:hypothetical protein [Silvibacterium bohemicum]MBB6143394.1 hypothetical protein [Silvibacterium bohemicum]